MHIISTLMAIIALVAPHKHNHHPPTQPEVASWYDDSGQTASGRHFQYGFASLKFGSRWGKRIVFCYRNHCRLGRMDDHGPYVGGRGFDLNPSLKYALHCPDICHLRWR